MLMCSEKIQPISMIGASLRVALSACVVQGRNTEVLKRYFYGIVVVCLRSAGLLVLVSLAMELTKGPRKFLIAQLMRDYRCTLTVR